MWNIIFIILWWSLDFFILYHFLLISIFPILAHEVPLVFLLMQIGNLFIIRHKIWIFNITVWNLITITVYGICNLYYFIICTCISINSPCISTSSQYPRNKYWPSATNFGHYISTWFTSSCSNFLAQRISLILIRISSYFIIIPSSCSLINIVESVVNNVSSLHTSS